MLWHLSECEACQASPVSDNVRYPPVSDRMVTKAGWENNTREQMGGKD